MTSIATARQQASFPDPRSAEGREVPCAQESGVTGILGGSALGEAPAGHMVGVSAAFRSACDRLSLVAGTQAAVLLTGESGVGKTMFARMLHRIGSRSGNPFVSVHCAAISEARMESELFGIEHDAVHPDAPARAGRFEHADTGTLFLDEVEVLGLSNQRRLLTALNDGQVERVGSAQGLRVDVRVVVASRADLAGEVRAGRFRQDLLDRLEVFSIAVPPLRERRQDIPPLLSHFLHLYRRVHGKRLAGYAPSAVKALVRYRFPGNIRQLQNMVERGVIQAPEDGVVELQHMVKDENLDDVSPPGPSAPSLEAVAQVASTLPLFERLADPATGIVALEDVERQLLQEAVKRTEGNLSAAARLLGITRPKLAYRLRAQADTQG